EAFDGGFVERDGGADLGQLPVAGGGGLARQLGGELPEVAGQVLADQELDQAHRQRRRPALEEVGDDRPLAVDRELRVGQGRLQLGRALQLAAELGQLVLDALEDALGSGDLEDAGGVTRDPVHYLLSSSAMYLSTRPS